MKNVVLLITCLLSVTFIAIQFPSKEAQARGNSPTPKPIQRPTRNPIPIADPCSVVKNQLTTCQDGLNTCQTNFNSCNLNLDACSSNLNTTNANLNACSGNLNTCDNALDQATASGNQCGTNLGECNNNLESCSDDLDTCGTQLDECTAALDYKLPGDGVTGAPLSYTDNGDGTFTDNNTGLIWEMKDDAGGVHDIDNEYKWTTNLPNPDGSLFTEFLDTLNNKCNGDETTPCNTDADCAGIGDGLCGFAGYQDWCIPNKKQYETILDLSKIQPAISFPGLTKENIYWTSTIWVKTMESVWVVSEGDGGNGQAHMIKEESVRARAVRPCN